MKTFFLRLDQKLKQLMVQLFYEKNYARIKVNTDDNLPLIKPLKFPTLTIVIRCVFQKDEELYPQIYLNG